MRPLRALEIIGLGFVLVVLGFLLPLLMVMQIIEASFLLTFIAYIASFTGLILGIIGAAYYTRHRDE